MNKLDTIREWFRICEEVVLAEPRFGIRKDAGRRQAHALVEVEGQVVSDRGVSVATFIPMTSTLSRPLIWTTITDMRLAQPVPALERD